MKFTTNILSMLALGILVACGSNPTESQAPISAQENNLRIQVGSLQSAGIPIQVDSAVLEIRGVGMSTIRHSQSLTTDSIIKLDHIPAGASRSIELSLYNNKGQLLFHGDTLMELAGGVETPLKLRLDQQFGTLRASVPLPLSQNVVAGGSMWVSKGAEVYKTAFIKNTGSGEFKLSPVPFGENYTLNIKLWDEKGDTLYTYTGVVDVRSGLTQNLNIRLQSLYARLNLSLEVNTQVTQNIDLEIPGSILRNPKQMGELIFTELMPNPGVSADSLEWLEVYNASSDTLDLHTCAIRKSRTTTSSSTNLWFDSTRNSKIAPGKTLVLGREKIEFADGNYHSFTMTNSGQDLLIVCNQVLIDSIYYNDSKFPISSGVSMQLDLSKFLQRLDSASWCSGKNSIGTLPQKGSPKQTPSCI